MKVYAKNPAELVIQNPTPKKNHNKMAKRKRDSKGRFMSKKKRKKRSNPSPTENGSVSNSQSPLQSINTSALKGFLAGVGLFFIHNNHRFSDSDKELTFK